MVSVIITAGGIGKRMGHPIPKQFIELAGKPLLMHSISRFKDALPHCQLILTLPADWIEEWEKLCGDHQFEIEHQIVSGGVERYDSINNAIEVTKGELIMVHDGVRPLVSQDTILRCLDGLKEYQAVVPIIELKDSVRELTSDTTSRSVDRSKYVLVQTPQCFTRELFLRAYNQPFDRLITDDASLVERLGEHVHLVQGNLENIKITTVNDLVVGEAYLSSTFGIRK